MENEYERLSGEILWFEALRDTLDAGDIESVRRSIDSAVQLKRRERARLDDRDLTP